jgi:hypothetical protein
VQADGVKFKDEPEGMGVDSTEHIPHLRTWVCLSSCKQGVHLEIVWLMLVLFLSTGTHQNSFLHVLQSLVLQGLIFSASIYL